MDGVLAVLAESGAGEPRLVQHLREAVAGVDVLDKEGFVAALARGAASLPARAAVFLQLPTIAALDVVSNAARRGFRRLIVVSEHGSVATAVEVMRRGAHEYLCAPAGIGDLLSALEDQGPTNEPESAGKGARSVAPSLDRAIWEYINFVLAGAGTVAEAARRLGVDRRSLRRMLAQHPPRR